jgi:hypothetical protein
VGLVRTLSNDPLTKTRQIFVYDDTDDSFRIITEQDSHDLYAQSQAERNAMDERANWKGDMHHVARLPMVVYHELKRKGIIDDPAAFKRWLNDPDNKVFRTRPGRV